MNGSIHAWVAVGGQIVRWGMSKPETVATHLGTLTPLSDVQVCYCVCGRPYLATAEHFLRRYEAWCERRSGVCG